MVGAGAGGGGGYNATRSKTASVPYTEGGVKKYTLSIPITATMKNFIIKELMGGGGGGGAGGTYSVARCTDYSDFKVVNDDQEVELCVSPPFTTFTKSQLTSGGVSACFSYVNVGPTTYYHFNQLDGSECPFYSLNTSASAANKYCVGENTSTGTSGSSLRNVLCNYKGASALCSVKNKSTLNLSDIAKFSKMNNRSNFISSLNSASSPSIDCGPDGCKNYFPRLSGTFYVVPTVMGGPKLYYGYVSGSSSISTSYLYEGLADDVGIPQRNVVCKGKTDNGGTMYLSGAGGSSAQTIRQWIHIDDEVIKKNEGRTIYMEAGKGGSGGTNCSDSSFTNGQCSSSAGGSGGDGKQSYFRIQTSASSKYYEITVDGGKGGGGGNSTSKARSGKYDTDKSQCRVFNSYSNPTTTYVNSGIYYAYDGSREDGNSTIQFNGTAGGNLSYSSNDQPYYGGAGGTYSVTRATINGKGGSGWGSGGGGGGIYRPSGSYLYIGNGGKGSDGYVRISYDDVSGYAGSGGASGSVLAIDGVKVAPNKLYKIYIPAGGKGGEAGEDGYYETFKPYGSEDSDWYTGHTVFYTDSGEFHVYPAASGKAANASGHASAPETGGTMVWTDDMSGMWTLPAQYSSMKSAVEKSGVYKKVEFYPSVNGTAGGDVSGKIKGGNGGLTAVTTAGYGSGGEERGGYGYFKIPDILNKDYGYAGSGGGGGGWLYSTYSNKGVAGKGGDGAKGYVYIYWKKVFK